MFVDNMRDGSALRRWEVDRMFWMRQVSSWSSTTAGLKNVRLTYWRKTNDFCGRERVRERERERKEMKRSMERRRQIIKPNFIFFVAHLHNTCPRPESAHVDMSCRRRQERQRRSVYLFVIPLSHIWTPGTIVASGRHVHSTVTLLIQTNI